MKPFNATISKISIKTWNDPQSFVNYISKCCQRRDKHEYNSYITNDKQRTRKQRTKTTRLHLVTLTLTVRNVYVSTGNNYRKLKRWNGKSKSAVYDLTFFNIDLGMSYPWSINPKLFNLCWFWYFISMTKSFHYLKYSLPLVYVFINTLTPSNTSFR
jgi:hypothetical protein